MALIEALFSWLAQRKRQRLHEEIARFAKDQAGTEFDLDEELEQVGIEAILAERTG
ncbi:MAG TPA: hypothetical protein VFE33_04590 [Thermoanaerobaculia bacterium]|nr:hypothetical protein [Thermoanaerobaculia bacterium]